MYDMKRPARVSPELELVSKGTAWFDEIRLVPDVWVNTSVDNEINGLMVELYTPLENSELFYRFFDVDPIKAQKEALEADPDEYMKYDGNPVLIEGLGVLDVQVRQGDRITGKRKASLFSHKAIGKTVSYNTMFSPAYQAEGEEALVDGRIASKWYKCPYWQAFEGIDAEVIIDLGQVLSIEEVSMNFLNDPDVWIFLPRQVKVALSQEGFRWENWETVAIPQRDDDKDASIHTLTIGKEKADARYIKVKAENIGTCPRGHKGEGGKAWLFIDEVIIR
jgi:hexosaminidase